jgi:hypothetical protein
MRRSGNLRAEAISLGCGNPCRKACRPCSFGGLKQGPIREKFRFRWVLLPHSLWNTANGLFLVLTGSSDWILSTFEGKWASAHVSSFGLCSRALAVIVGGIGAWRSTSFVATAVGVTSSLIARTALRHISFLPGLLLFLIVTCRSVWHLFAKMARPRPRCLAHGGVDLKGIWVFDAQKAEVRYG